MAAVAPPSDWTRVLIKAENICESKSVVRILAPMQCRFLIERVQNLHNYLLRLVEFKGEVMLRECKPTILQIDRLLDRVQFLLRRCSSPDWVWHAVLKKEHKLKFQILVQELSQSVYFLKLKVSAIKGALTLSPQAWEWPSSERQELKRAAKTDRDNLKDAAATLRDNPDPHIFELGKYLLAEEEHKRCQVLPGYLFRNPEKVFQGELIGEGSYAYVYEATWLERTIATKAYAEQDPNSEKELLTLFSLRHPHIVKMLGYTQRSKEGPYVILMERMERDLHNLIRDMVKAKPEGGPPFEMDVAIDIILQIARGMEFLHANDVSHSDLKTANILVNLPRNKCNFYNVKLSDFGLAETKLKSAQTKLPRVRRAGTVNFMAPEIWNEESNANRKKADVYSFGMTCYHVFTGNLPFQGCSYPAAGFFLRVKDHNLRPTLPPNFPKCLSLFLQCCWHGRPEIRPTFKKICNYLVALKNVLTIGDPPHALPEKHYLNSPIGNILDEQKQLDAMGMRDHHEAILAALESLQKEAQDNLLPKSASTKYKSSLKSYMREVQRLTSSVKVHKNKFIDMQRRAAREEEDEENSERKGSRCSCFQR